MGVMSQTDFDRDSSERGRDVSIKLPVFVCSCSGTAIRLWITKQAMLTTGVQFSITNSKKIGNVKHC